MSFNSHHGEIYMDAKNTALLSPKNEKQSALIALRAEIDKERDKKDHIRSSGVVMYSIVVQNLAKRCWSCGCSTKEIAEAAKVTEKTVINWIRKTSGIQVRELNIVPNKPTEITASVQNNALTVVKKPSNVTDKVELEFPSGVRLSMTAEMFAVNIVQHLFTKQG